MLKYIQTIIVCAYCVSASQTMDYPVHIPTDHDTIRAGVALVAEGQRYAYHDHEDFVSADGKNRLMRVASQWDERQGVKAELYSNEITLRAAYFDDNIRKTVQRFKNGKDKEDFFRKEDLAKFLELGIGTKHLDIFFSKEFSTFGTYTLGDDKPKPFTTSMMKLGVKASQKTVLGSMGVFMEGQKFKRLRVLRIGQIDDKGNVSVLRTLGPVNKEVYGVVGGFFKAPDPSGKIYLTTAGGVGIGVSESPLQPETDIDMPGYYLFNEGYDLLCDVNGSIILGMNLEFGRLKLRASAELFTRATFSAPASNVYPDGVSPGKVPKNTTLEDYNEMFTEEYSLVDAVYGFSTQVKIIF